MTKSKLIVSNHRSPLSTLSQILSGEKYHDTKFFLLVDENSYQYCLPEIISRVKAFEETEFIEVPTSEECKTLAIAEQVWSGLMESGADRNTILVNIGGGCVSDLGGFVAAGYKRGIRYINIPTTIIGMVDAAIGGKTAVNFELCKNQIGFFHQPEIVCINPSFIDTLPEVEQLNGVYEIIKTFAVADDELYKHMMNEIVNGNVPLENDLIFKCAEIKQQIVKQDPTDHGIRKILNFGHTFGHAIESYSHEQKQPLRHGEAVGIGMMCAMYLSTQKIGLDNNIYEQYCTGIHKMMKIPKYTLKDTEEILKYMRQDKKCANGEILCVLLQELGAAMIDVPIDENEIRATLLKIK